MPGNTRSSQTNSGDRPETAVLLKRCRDGDTSALDAVFERVYIELRMLAHRVRGGARDTMGTTGLIHETYLKLNGASQLSAKDRRHFCRIAARAMRQILINAAEARISQKRGAGQPHLSLIEELVGSEADGQRMMDIDRVLDELRERDERMADVVELRYFAGYTSEECADLLEVSVPTVQRDWRMAKAWLAQSLSE